MFGIFECTKTSLGPNGRSKIIRSSTNSHFVTRDGNLMLEAHFSGCSDPMEKAMMKNCFNVFHQCGDGTLSTLILVQELIGYNSTSFVQSKSCLGMILSAFYQLSGKMIEDICSNYSVSITSYEEAIKELWKSALYPSANLMTVNTLINLLWLWLHSGTLNHMFEACSYALNHLEDSVIVSERFSSLTSSFVIPSNEMYLTGRCRNHSELREREEDSMTSIGKLEYLFVCFENCGFSHLPTGVELIFQLDTDQHKPYGVSVMSQVIEKLVRDCVKVICCCNSIEDSVANEVALAGVVVVDCIPICFLRRLCTMSNSRNYENLNEYLADGIEESQQSCALKDRFASFTSLARLSLGKLEPVIHLKGLRQAERTSHYNPVVTQICPQLMLCGFSKQAAELYLRCIRRALKQFVFHFSRTNEATYCQRIFPGGGEIDLLWSFLWKRVGQWMLLQDRELEHIEQELPCTAIKTTQQISGLTNNNWFNELIHTVGAELLTACSRLGPQQNRGRKSLFILELSQWCTNIAHAYEEIPKLLLINNSATCNASQKVMLESRANRQLAEWKVRVEQSCLGNVVQYERVPTLPSDFLESRVSVSAPQFCFVFATVLETALMYFRVGGEVIHVKKLRTAKISTTLINRRTSKFDESESDSDD